MKRLNDLLNELAWLEVDGWGLSIQQRMVRMRDVAMTIYRIRRER